MQQIFGSSIRGKILHTLSQSSNISLKEISDKTGENYRSVSKILKELEKAEYVAQYNKKYCLTSKFINLIIELQNSLVDTYHCDLFLEKKHNIYHLVKCIDSYQDIEKKISKYLTNYLLKRIDLYMEESYDLDNKEFKYISNLINTTFNSTNISVLEVGCRTGRITKQLSKYYQSITAIDMNSSYLNCCKKKCGNNVEFYNYNFENLEVNSSFDVIVFSKCSFINDENLEQLLSQIQYYKKDKTLVIIKDEDFQSQYKQLLFSITKSRYFFNNQKQFYSLIIEKFKNFQTQNISTYYQLDSISKLVEQVKIQLSLEYNYHWNVEMEEQLKKALLKLENPLSIEDRFWISSFVI